MNYELFREVRLGHVNEVRHLLSCEPELVSFQDEKGNQPMHIAVLQGDVEMVKLLTEFDAPLGRRNYDGLTVYGCCRMSNNRDLITLLETFYSADNTRCGQDPERKFYNRINHNTIPSQAFLQKKKNELMLLKRIEEWRDLERFCLVSRVQRQVRKFLKKKAGVLQSIRVKSATRIQIAWRWKYRYKVHRNRRRAAVLLQSFERMRVVYIKYTYFDRERLILYRDSRRLAVHLQRLWRGYVGRAASRRMMEIKILPDPQLPRNFDFWLQIQTVSSPPARMQGIFLEYVLSGCPKSWKHRNVIKRNGHFRDVKFYVNSITRKVSWEQPKRWQDIDSIAKRQRISIINMGFTLEQNRLASSLQLLWRAKKARIYLLLLLKANRIMSRAQENFDTDPKNMTSLVNYTLYAHANLFNNQRVGELYEHCLSRMMKRGGDNSVILYGYVIYSAKKGEAVYGSYLSRAQRSEKKSIGRQSSKVHSFDLADAYFRYIALSIQSYDALCNYGICRLLVYTDKDGSKEYLSKALRLCKSNDDRKMLNEFILH